MPDRFIRPIGDLCPVCEGAGYIVTASRGTVEKWRCGVCHGCGVTKQFGPALIGKGGRKMDLPRD